MDRYAIFLDAGYLFSAGAQVTNPGQKIVRKSISLKAPDMAVADLCAFAAGQLGNLPLLRAYWYDATPGSRPSLEQSTLAMLPGVKLRLGILNNFGEQKGVDSLIVTDLIELSRNRAISDAVIVAGDEDLRIAFQVAQSFGVRAHILAAGDPKTNVSSTLQMEADSVWALPTHWFKTHLIVTPIVPVATAPVALTSSATKPSTNTQPAPASAILSLDTAAEKVSQELLANVSAGVLATLKAHFATSNSVPPEFDRPLIGKTAVMLAGRKFTGDEMRHIRGIFVTTVRAKKL